MPLSSLSHSVLLQANNAVEPVQETVDVPQEEQPEPAVHASQEAAAPKGQEAPEDDFKVWALNRWAWSMKQDSFYLRVVVRRPPSLGCKHDGVYNTQATLRATDPWPCPCRRCPKWVLYASSSSRLPCKDLAHAYDTPHAKRRA